MSLIIKDEETCRLASELAELTGETTASAIAAALRKAVEREREVRERVRKMMEIGERCAAAVRASQTDGPSAVDIGDWLYDEHGLPR